MRCTGWLIVLVVGLGGCRRTTPPPKAARRAAAVPRQAAKGPQVRGYPIQVQDDRGQVITIPRRPQRIVVGGTPLYTEILLDLGAASRLVGVADSPDTPAALKHVASVGRAWPLNVEKVMALRPDIVFCAMAKARQKLEQDAQIKVFTGGGAGGFIQSVDALFALIGKIDLIVHGNQQRAKALIQQLKQGLDKVSQAIATQARVKVAIIYVPKPQSAKIYVIGAASSPGSSLLKRAMGHNVFAEQKGGLLGIEALLMRNPDVIITDPRHVERLYQHRMLRSLKAIRNKRVVGIKASHYTSSKVLRVFRQLCQALHPRLVLPSTTSKPTTR